MTMVKEYYTIPARKKSIDLFAGVSRSGGHNQINIADNHAKDQNRISMANKGLSGSSTPESYHYSGIPTPATSPTSAVLGRFSPSFISPDDSITNLPLEYTDYNTKVPTDGGSISLETQSGLVQSQDEFHQYNTSPSMSSADVREDLAASSEQSRASPLLPLSPEEGEEQVIVRLSQEEIENIVKEQKAVNSSDFKSRFNEGSSQPPESTANVGIQNKLSAGSRSPDYYYHQFPSIKQGSDQINSDTFNPGDASGRSSKSISGGQSQQAPHNWQQQLVESDDSIRPLLEWEEAVKENLAQQNLEVSKKCSSADSNEQLERRESRGTCASDEHRHSDESIIPADTGGMIQTSFSRTDNDDDDNNKSQVLSEIDYNVNCFVSGDLQNSRDRHSSAAQKPSSHEIRQQNKQKRKTERKAKNSIRAKQFWADLESNEEHRLEDMKVTDFVNSTFTSDEPYQDANAPLMASTSSLIPTKQGGRKEESTDIGAEYNQNHEPRATLYSLRKSQHEQQSSNREAKQTRLLSAVALSLRSRYEPPSLIGDDDDDELLQNEDEEYVEEHSDSDDHEDSNKHDDHNSNTDNNFNNNSGNTVLNRRMNETNDSGRSPSIFQPNNQTSIGSVNDDNFNIDEEEEEEVEEIWEDELESRYGNTAILDPMLDRMKVSTLLTHDYHVQAHDINSPESFQNLEALASHMPVPSYVNEAIPSPEMRDQMNYDLALGSAYHPKRRRYGSELPEVCELDCGEDAFFATRRPKGDWLIGMADGVGGWTSLGVDPSLFAWNLMQNIRALSSSPITDTQQLIQQGFQNLKSEAKVKAGSSTVCLATFDKTNGILHASNLGDSGLLILRRTHGTACDGTGGNMRVSVIDSASNSSTAADTDSLLNSSAGNISSGFGHDAQTCAKVYTPILLDEMRPSRSKSSSARTSMKMNNNLIDNKDKSRRGLLGSAYVQDIAAEDDSNQPQSNSEISMDFTFGNQQSHGLAAVNKRPNTHTAKKTNTNHDFIECDGDDDHLMDIDKNTSLEADEGALLNNSPFSSNNKSHNTDQENSRSEQRKQGQRHIQMQHQRRRKRDSRIFDLHYKPVHKSIDIQHWFNAPYQLSVVPEQFYSNGSLGDDPKDSTQFEQELAEGDMIIMATDGLWDNLFPDEIAEIASKCLNEFLKSYYSSHDNDASNDDNSDDNNTDNSFHNQNENSNLAKDSLQQEKSSLSQESTDIIYEEVVENGRIETRSLKSQETMRACSQKIAEAITRKAKIASQDEDRNSPFSMGAKTAGRLHLGGKTDDITVLVAYVLKIMP